MFIFTLTQEIKIFSFQGVAWVQVVAAVYLLSYLISASLQVLGQDQEIDETYTSMNTTAEWGHRSYPRLLKNSAGMLLIISLVSSFLLCSWATSEICDSANESLHWQKLFDSHNLAVSIFLLASVVLGIYIGGTCTIVFGFAIIFVSVFGLLLLKNVALGDPNRQLSIHNPVDLLIGVLATPLLFWLFTVFVSWLWSTRGILASVADGAGMLLLSLGLSWLGAWLLIQILGRGRKRYWSSRMDWSLLLVLISFTHLVVACLYFGYAFDPTGTVKPAWTEKLG